MMNPTFETQKTWIVRCYAGSSRNSLIESFVVKATTRESANRVLLGLVDEALFCATARVTVSTR